MVLTRTEGVNVLVGSKLNFLFILWNGLIVFRILIASNLPIAKLIYIVYARKSKLNVYNAHRRSLRAYGQVIQLLMLCMR